MVLPFMNMTVTEACGTNFITELYIYDCSAMRKFQSLDRQARVETNDTTLETIHQNAITCLCVYKGGKGWASSVSTSGLDGQLVIWDLQVGSTDVL
jgi:WD40 repeat protein